MEQTSKTIEKLKEKYPDIDYYQLIIDKIKSNNIHNPDISIEACKSLLEGLSKFIIKNLDKGSSINEINAYKLPQLCRKALSKLNDYNHDFEDDFANRTIAVITSISEIRNQRGDISHGKLAPKEIFSNNLFSNFVMQTTDAIACYILQSFSKVNLIKEIDYTDNHEFNNWLDEIYEFGNLKYSKALFDQDFDAYSQELLSYIDMMDKNK